MSNSNEIPKPELGLKDRLTDLAIDSLIVAMMKFDDWKGRLSNLGQTGAQQQRRFKKKLAAQASPGPRLAGILGAMH